MATRDLPSAPELEGTVDHLSKAASDVDFLRGTLESVMSNKHDAGHAAVMGVKWEVAQPKIDEATVGRLYLFVDAVVDSAETLKENAEQIRKLARTLYLDQEDEAFTSRDYAEWATQRASQLESEAARYRESASTAKD